MTEILPPWKIWAVISSMTNDPARRAGGAGGGGGVDSRLSDSSNYRRKYHWICRLTDGRSALHLKQFTEKLLQQAGNMWRTAQLHIKSLGSTRKQEVKLKTQKLTSCEDPKDTEEAEVILKQRSRCVKYFYHGTVKKQLCMFTYSEQQTSADMRRPY